MLIYKGGVRWGMDSMAAFIIAMVLAVLALRLGLQPFLSLVMASLAFGLLAGLGAGTLVHINDGLGAIF